MEKYFQLSTLTPGNNFLFGQRLNYLIMKLFVLGKNDRTFIYSFL